AASVSASGASSVKKGKCPRCGGTLIALTDLRADVVTALGLRQRTRVTINGDFVDLEELVERVTPGAADWVPIKTTRVVAADRQVTFTGWKPVAQVDDGTSANPPAIDTDMTGLQINCWPDGRCDGATVYFTGPNGSAARTIVLPLGGAVMARRGF
ncbi:MAG: hypothetical protein HC863_02345, partial [Myxococcales bacterium]|nr:hypothetical protein [Myxococcales bacterium]